MSKADPPWKFAGTKAAPLRCRWFYVLSEALCANTVRPEIGRARIGGFALEGAAQLVAVCAERPVRIRPSSDRISRDAREARLHRQLLQRHRHALMPLVIDGDRRRDALKVLDPPRVQPPCPLFAWRADDDDARRHRGGDHEYQNQCQRSFTRQLRLSTSSCRMSRR